jgi:hypothetical protein
MQFVYLRVRRLVPLIVGHWLMDLASVLFMVSWLHDPLTHSEENTKMKAVSLPFAVGPSVLMIGLLAVTVLVIALTGARIPLLSNLRVSLVMVIVLGMAMCAQGIGRVAAANQWTHPLSIAGYALGGLILLVAASVWTGIRLPYLQGDRQALLAIAILTSTKILNSVVHSLLSRNGR